jgi:poly-gamma-glutamate synthesis protein (capsule biosynthesis protein)
MRRLCFLGDVWLPHAVKSHLAFQGDFIFNLESPITKWDKATPGKINLKAERDYILDTFGRVPIAVCLANNHIMDYGEEGYQDTLRSLADKGIEHFGAGRLADNCNNPLMLTSGALRVAVMGYAAEDSSPIFATGESLGAMPADLDSMIEDVCAARSAGADRTVVSLHWGAQEVYLPKPEAVQTAHALIDAGADLIIGHHAHCIQPYEIYNGKHIFYGLGNCIFPDVPVPAFFNEKGQPTQCHRNRQQRWNRISLAVNFSPETASVDVSVLRFDGTALNVTGGDPKRYMMDFSSLNRYDKRFKRSHAYGKLRAALASYLCQPRIPRPRDVWTLISLLLRREYAVYK